MDFFLQTKTEWSVLDQWAYTSSFQAYYSLQAQAKQPRTAFHFSTPAVSVSWDSSPVQAFTPLSLVATTAIDAAALRQVPGSVGSFASEELPPGIPYAHPFSYLPAVRNRTPKP